MDDSVKSGSRLEVSVSFGRFENDALSWEKWSSFSPNKYLEEVGNLSTPGSVAAKKAYFEAHYKKIAAKKAEELEQEKLMGPVISSPDASSKEDCYANSSEIDNKFDLSNGEKLVEEVVAVRTNVDVSNKAEHDNIDRSSEGDEMRACTNGFVDVIDLDKEKEDVNAVDNIDRSSEGDETRACTNGFVDVVDLDKEKEDVNAVVNCESSEIEEAKDESNVSIDEPELNVGKDFVSVVLETPLKDSRDIVQKRPERRNGREQTNVLRKEKSKSGARNTTQMATRTKNERNSVMTKKKVVSPVTKPLQAATPRYSKPTSMSTPISASQSLKKKANGLKSNNVSVGESKRAEPTSLHMSLSLGPTNSLGAFSMTRKSLIMERMGDKDIVKRAFRTFQNRTNGSTADEKTSKVKHVSSAALEPKVSSFHTPTKGFTGPRKDTEKTATPRSHLGTKSNPLPSGSHKSSALARKNTMAVSVHTVLKSDEKSERRKEFLKKLETKSIAREAATAQLSAKSRAGVASEIHQRPTLSR